MVPGFFADIVMRLAMATSGALYPSCNISDRPWLWVPFFYNGQEVWKLYRPRWLQQGRIILPIVRLPGQ